MLGRTWGNTWDAGGLGSWGRPRWEEVGGLGVDVGGLGGMMQEDAEDPSYLYDSSQQTVQYTL